MDKAKKFLDKEMYGLLRGYIDFSQFNEDDFVGIGDAYYYKSILRTIQDQIHNVFKFSKEIHCVAMSIFLNEIHFKYTQREMGLDAFHNKLEMYNGIDDVLRLAKSFEKGELNIEYIDVKLRREFTTIDQSTIPNSFVYNQIKKSKDNMPDKLRVSNKFLLSLVLRELPNKIKELAELKENAEKYVFGVKGKLKTPKVDIIKNYILPLERFVSTYCQPKNNTDRNVLIAKFLCCVGMFDKFDESEYRRVSDVVRYYIDSAEAYS